MTVLGASQLAQPTVAGARLTSRRLGRIPPVCSAFDETTGNLVRPIAISTSSVALTGTLMAGDTLIYHCVGYQ